MSQELTARIGGRAARTGAGAAHGQAREPMGKLGVCFGWASGGVSTKAAQTNTRSYQKEGMFGKRGGNTGSWTLFEMKAS